MTNENQKGTALTGGAVSDEVFASSASILAPGSYGSGQKGLQQFYTPEKAAQLVAQVIGEGPKVLDPTAGDGSLLKFFGPTNSFGIEIDPDQIKNAEGSYHALRGDVQHIYPLLRQAIPSWDAIVANPPFGLQWSDPTYRDGKSTNSTVLTFIYAMRLLTDQGQLAFIAGRDRFYRQITDLSEASGIYAVIECDDMFPGTTLPSVLAFGIHPNNRAPSSEGFVTRQVNLDMIDLLGKWVTDAREDALGGYNSVVRRTYGYDRPDNFITIQKEHDRRLEGRVKANREFDALLVGGKTIQWLPSGFAILALQETGDGYAFHGLNGQNINYFTTNERLWNKLLQYADQGILTIEPKLVEAVEFTIGSIRRERVPLYMVKPQQRLGFLIDIEYLRCKKDDPERGFNKGDSYRLDTRTEVVVTVEQRVVESKKNPGEYGVQNFERQAKMMKVTVGHHTFADGGSEASTNIKWLIDHFELPDPGDVSTKHPAEIALIEALADEVLDMFLANSREWEKDNPESMPFTKRPFQAQDISRLVFKGGGLLAWEQGLGKTLGGLLFMEMAWRMGAQKAGLVITANDLIDQWCRESQRFLGYEPIRLEGKPAFSWEMDEDGNWKKKKYVGYHGQAHTVKRLLKDPAAGGFWITHYEAMCINGTRGRSKPLPVVTVREWEEDRLVKGTDRHNRYYWVTAEGAEVGNDEDLLNHLLTVDPEFHALMEGEYGYRRGRLAHDKGFIQEPTQDNKGPHGCRTSYGYITARTEKITKRLTSRDLCPQCEADHDNGWNGSLCSAELIDGSTCGYAHFAVRMKPISALLSNSFKRGVVMLDEITKMQGETSITSKMLRGLTAKWRLGLTGTPIKNYIHQAYWPLWWCLGNASVRFPFAYEGGKTRFENDFSVIEYTKSGSRRENRSVLPEVTNLSTFWRLLSSSAIRRRKEETGEPLVDKFYHEVNVPVGIAQAELMEKMLKDFDKLFEEKFPDSKLVKSGMHTILKATIGLNWKLQYACALPEADPDADWWGIDGVSNYTPAALRTLELAMALAKDGRKVLLGSVLKDAGRWYADRLNEKGVKSLHILDESGNTTEAKKRAKIVHAFQTSEAQVFCAGVKSIRLGHNLDKADAVIINGLDFDWETLDQFVARIHRLTSQNPVDVFVVLPQLEGQDTITSRIWKTLGMKGASTELALDGRLIEKAEHAISKDELMKELVERGFHVTDECVDEVSVQEAWEAIPDVTAWDSTGIIPERPVAEDYTAQGAEAAKVVGLFFQAGYKGEQQLDLDAIVIPAEFELEQNAAEFDAIDAAEAELAAAEAAILAELAPREGPPLEDGSFLSVQNQEAQEAVFEAATELLAAEDDLDIEDEGAETLHDGELDMSEDMEPWAATLVAEPMYPEDEPEGVELTEDENAVSVVTPKLPLFESGKPELGAEVDAMFGSAEIEPEPVVAAVTKSADLPPVASTSIADEIRGLAELHREGILDETEFKDAKTILLHRLKGGA